MAQWDAIVVGAGLGGLAAGAALARAHKRVLVLERLGNLGGAATIYRHGALTIEASLHETDGAEFFSDHGVLRQLGVAAGLEPIATEEFYEVRSALFGAPVRVPHTLEAAQAALAGRFGHAAAPLSRYFALLRRLHETIEGLEDAGVRGPGALLGALFSGRLFEMLGLTRRTLAEELEAIFGADEAVKLALTPHLFYLDDDADKLSFVLFAMVTARYLEHGSFYLAGGSAAITRALAGAIGEAGGLARRKRTVTDILLDGEGRAAGVRHIGPDGAAEEDHAPVVFGNAAPDALAAMLPEAARADFTSRYAGFEPSISLFTIALGLDQPAARFGVSAYSTFILPDWMTRLDQVPVSADVFGGEPGAALPAYCVCDYGRLTAGRLPEGDLHLLTLTGVDRLWAWAELSEAEEHARRRAWTDVLIADLDRRYPTIAGAVRQSEMATARTLQTRMGTPGGAVYGFRPTPARLFGQPPTPRTSVPGLWLASAYTVGGGYAGALHGGLLAGQAALAEQRRRDRKRAHAAARLE